MKFLKDITEDEMIAIFLKGEIGSSRFGFGIVEVLKNDKRDKRVIENPDINKKEENEYRRKVFKICRGYGENTRLFEKFPNNMKWERVILNKSDLQKLKYINYDYWVELSGGTRFAVDGAKNILSGKEVFKQSNDGFIKAVESLKKGVKFGELILVATDKHSDLILLEGHLRATAYCMVPEYVSEDLEAVIGYSTDLRNWNLY